MRLHSIAVLWLLCAAPAAASDIALIGTFESKAAILSINAGAPKTIRVGQAFGGVTVISVDKDRATVDVDGKRRILVRGQTYHSGAGGADRQSVTLQAGEGGHMATQGLVNGGAVRFIVDTGATLVSLPGSDAARLGIDYRNGAVGTVQTAGGPTPAYWVKFNTVRVGDIELNNVDGIVIEKGLTVALLGMSFLNRVEMKQENGRMTMIRRF